MTEENAADSAKRRQPIDTYVLLATVAFFAYVSLKIVSPFLSVFLWSAILSVAIFPMHQKAIEMLGGRVKLSAMLLGLLGLLVLLTPVAWLAQSVFESMDRFELAIEDKSFSIPAPKESIKEWPIIGEDLYTAQSEAHENFQLFISEHADQIKKAARNLIGTGTQLLGSVAEFALSIIFACVFLLYAQPLGNTLKQLAGRINEENGERFVNIAAATTRNVSKAVVGIALIQSLLGATGFFVVGLPFAGIWSAALLATALVTLPMVIIIPSIIYVWTIASTGTAMIFTVFMIGVMLIDNIFRPIIAAKGLPTPTIIIFVGVIGGALSLGLIGLFVGPVILAVFYEIMVLWTTRSRDAQAQG